MNEIVPYLPHLQAALNCLSAVFLTAGFYYIKRGQKQQHMRCMIAAIAVSAVFLVSYLIYHAHVGHYPFMGEGAIRPIYFTLLIGHILMAVLALPMILLTTMRAWRQDFVAHPKIARKTWPVWIFVSVSGVVVYAMAYHLYTAPVS